VKLLKTMMAVSITAAALSLAVPSSNAAAMDMMMKHKHHGHMMGCKGEFMMMDKKSHKCVDARN